MRLLFRELYFHHALVWYPRHHHAGKIPSLLAVISDWYCADA
jgi:hypothetical protein